MANSPFLPQPPRVRGDPAADSRAAVDWQWRFFQAIAIDNTVLVRATEYADPGLFDGANLPTPTGTTVARAQLTANNAWLLAALTAGNIRSGSMTFSDATAALAVTFATKLPDANYRVVASASGFTGSPAAGAFVTIAVAKSATGFTLAVLAAPGAGTSVTIDWIATRIT